MSNSEKVQNMRYGTFFVGEIEIGIDVNEVLEVVNFPATVIPVPLAPSFMLGVFNLRGMIIPVLSMSALLQTNEEKSNNKKIAILGENGVKFGLVFDSTREIIRIKDSDFSPFSYGETTSGYEQVSCAKRAVVGVIKLEDGKRLIQVVRTSELARIENLPYVLEKLKVTSQDLNKTKRNSKRKQCISFQLSRHHLALDISAVSEIIMMPQYQETALSSDLCLGMINLRGNTVPLIHMQKILGEEIQVGSREMSTKKVIVMNLGTASFGLVIDHVESIVSYVDEDLIPVPVFSKDRALLLSGCIFREGRAEILLLDHGKIFSNEDVAAITQGHSRLYKREGETKLLESRQKVSKMNSYITFYLEHLAALPILDVQEIISFPGNLNHTPGAPEYIIGMLNLRGKLVSIVDLRKTYQMNDFSDIETTQVLIVKSQGELFGLVVDSVDGLITINEDKKMAFPTLLQPQASEDLKCDVKEYVEAKADLSFKTTTMIFNLEAIITRIRQKLIA